MTRTEWLSSLAPGDKIIYRSRKYGVDRSMILTLCRLTPKQFVMIDGGKCMWRIRRADGRPIGKNGEIHPIY